MIALTLRLDDTVIVLKHVRAFRIESRYVPAPAAEQVCTMVWLKYVEHPLCIFGDHIEELTRALERRADSRLVLLESPFAGNVELNLQYARAAMRDAFLRHGEYPFASHLLYTQPGIVDDGLDEERTLGIEAGLAWGSLASRSVVYTDHGLSSGMRLGIERARAQGREVESRTVPGWLP